MQQQASSVIRASRALLIATALVALPAFVGCGGSKTGAITSVSISPANPTVSVGASLMLTATPMYAKNKGPSTKPTAIWNSSAPAIATVASNGLVRGVAVGSATITARIGNKTGMAVVTVVAGKMLTQLQIEPASPSIPIQQTVALTATGRYSDGTSANLTASVEWTSSAPNIVSVSNTGAKGLALAQAVGMATITATLGSQVATTVVTVRDVTPLSLAIEPRMDTIVRGSTRAFVATATFSDNSTLNVSESATWTSSMPAVATVSDAAGMKGIATGVAAGTSTVTVTLGTLTASAMLTVTNLTPTSLMVEGAAGAIAVGTDRQLTARVTFNNNTTQDVTNDAMWSSATPAVATVVAGKVTGASAGTSVISATFGGVTGMATVTVSTKLVASIQISPPTPTLARGTTRPYTATAVYNDNSSEIVTDQATWGSTAETVAGVSNVAGSKGLVTGYTPGMANITASFGGQLGSVALTVTGATLTELALTPQNGRIAVNTSVRFEARGRFDDGSNQDLTDVVTWTSSNAAAVTISNAAGSRGQASGLTAGSVTITATLGTIAKSTSLVVTSANLASITVSPPIARLAQTTQAPLRATGHFDDGTVQDVTDSASWTSTAAAVATVSAAAGSRGVVTGVSPGTAQIRATIGAVLGTAAVTVTNATLTSITLTPSTPTIAQNTSVNLRATGLFSDNSNQDLTGQVTWSSATPAVASVTSGGLTAGRVRGFSMGTSVVSATLGTVTGMTTVTVTNATLMTIEVTPTPQTIAKNTIYALTATGRFSDTTTQNLTDSVFWASANTMVATVSNGIGSEGQVTGVAAGTTNITATLLAVSGMAAVTVTDATLTMLEVTPAGQTIQVGESQQYTATGTFSDNSVQNLNLQAVWTSSMPAIASISNVAVPDSRGRATGLTQGMTTISAATLGMSASTGLTVSPPTVTLTALNIDQATPSVVVGSNVQLTVTGTFNDGSSRDLTEEATWSSSMVGVASISSAMGTRGRATGVAAGTSTITATVGSTMATVTLTVNAVPLVSISIGPMTLSTPLGRTLDLTADGVYDNMTNADITDDVTWTSSDPNIATIDNAMNPGRVNPVAVGTTTITATLGGITASRTFTVRMEELASITVTSPYPRIAFTTKVRLTATGTYTNGRTEDVTQTAVWGSGNAGVVTVSNVAPEIGVATGIAAGMTNVTATVDTIVGTLAFEVTNATITSMAISAMGAGPIGAAAGFTQQLVPTGTFSDNSMQVLDLQATWASTNTAQARVSNAFVDRGLVSALAIGMPTISAAFNGVIGTVVFPVGMQVLQMITVSPTPRTIAKGTQQQFTATGFFSDNSTSDVTGLATWTTSAATIATVGAATGLADGVNPGMATITASVTVGMTVVSGTATLNVTNATITALAVTPDPAPATIANGSTKQFRATGTFSDTSTQDLTAQVTWASSNLAFATIDGAGLATGRGVGAPEITAIFRDPTSGQPVAASATLTVTGAVPMSLAIMPMTAMVADGLTTQYQAIVTFTDGSTQDETTNVNTTWSSVDGAVATVNNAGSKGLVTGVDPGTTMITASYTAGAITVMASASVTVTPVVLTGLVVTPNPAGPVAVNATQQFTVVGTLSDGSMTMPLTALATWASSAPGVATISNAAGSQGQATALSSGMTTITALYMGFTGTATLTVP